MANSSSNSLSRGKILSALCLIIFALLFIFSCLSKSITLGAKIVGTFGVISYPLFLAMALFCLFKFLGFSYKRNIKATILMFCFIYCFLAVIHAIRTYSILNAVTSTETFNEYLKYPYLNLTLLGSIGSLLCGAISYLLGGVGTIIVFVILGTISIGLFIDFELYGKFEEKHIKKLKNRKLREKVLNSGNDLTENGSPKYSFSDEQTAYTDNDVVAGVTDDLENNQTQNKPYYSDSDVVAEISDNNVYDNGEQYQSNDNSKINTVSPNYFSSSFYNNLENNQNNYNLNNYNSNSDANVFGDDGVTNSFSNDVYKEPEYPDIYDENEQRRQFMRATFSNDNYDYNQNNYSSFDNSKSGSNLYSNNDNGTYSNSSYFGSDNNYSNNFGNNYSDNFNSDYSSNFSSSDSDNQNSTMFDMERIQKNYNDNDPYKPSTGYESTSSIDNSNGDMSSYFSGLDSSNDFNTSSSNSSSDFNFSSSNDFSSNSVDNKISEILSSGNDNDNTSDLGSNNDDFSFQPSDADISKSVENDVKNNFSFSDNSKPTFSEKDDDYKSFDNSSLNNDNFVSPINLSSSGTSSDSGYSNSKSFDDNSFQNEPKIKIPAKENAKKFNMSMGSSKYVVPPTSLLKTIESDKGNYDEEQARKAKGLEQVLDAFNIPVSVVNIVRGPKITRYELSVPLGVSIKKIPSYELDIKKSLAAKTVNIQAPIPGSEFVGIELENDTFTNVGLKELLDSDSFKNFTDPLPIAIGKDISGEIVVKSLSKMVHMLIAGQTGSGKSVFIHNIILSLIYKYSPDDLRLMLIDPKRVEFNRYNGLPHLVTPEVVLGTEKAVNALKWCVSEMDRRFKLMETAGYNFITTYNNSDIVKSGQLPRFPYLVIVLDEFAEVIMANKKDTEACIQRITQLARACGMHLILATQRPSVDVISGVIKNNVPSRVAFSLASAFDSKTIIGTTGAENLLGQGDMLFAPSGTSVISRLQAAYCSDDEIKKVIDYVKDNNASNYDDSVAISINSPLAKSGDGAGSSAGMPPEKEADSYFILALKLFIQRGEASASYLQRRLSIGYGRASRIMDQLESKGYVAPASGAKVRKVLITADQFKEKFGEDVNDSSGSFDE